MVEEEKEELENQASQTSGAKKKASNKNKGYTKEQMIQDAQNLEKKKIAKEANEALRELYGDDYEEPGENQNQAQ